ncbi:MAG: nucleotide exchange factor GrpE [bacterium]|nr:nucleotide exchange factor GrpE [bacterium]
MSDDTKKEAAATEVSHAKKQPSEIDKIKAERDEYLAGWQRAKADAVNASKRMAEDMKTFRAMATEGLIEELLPVLQSFEMAFANKEAWEKADKNWRTGIEHIHAQLKGVLAANGLAEIDPISKPFDPNLHEAVEYEKVKDVKQENMVVKVIEKGYSLGGKLVRPAKVVVGEKNS